jgi:hypothetical protein
MVLNSALKSESRAAFAPCPLAIFSATARSGLSASATSYTQPIPPCPIARRTV